MGLQTSRIIWGKTKMDPNDEGTNEVPVTDFERDIIYTSGNMAIDGDYTDMGVYQCKVSESCNNRPSLNTYEWKRLDGMAMIVTKFIPGAPTSAIESMNKARMLYTPGARVIVKEIDQEGEAHHYLYKCITKTNVYTEGFVKTKWEKVKHKPGILYIPRDHKDVYYNGKWHIAMYYQPNEIGDSEQEITRFNEFTQYYKGEIALNRNPGDEDVLDMEGKVVYAAYWTKAWRYTGDIPSQPTRLNADKEFEYRQPEPSHSSQYWEPIDDEIQPFDRYKAYKKGDMVVYNLYANKGSSEEISQGWEITNITLYDDNQMYMRGDRCLYKIKPTTSENISEKDCMALKETGDYDMLAPDPYFPSIIEPIPTSKYGELIANNSEIYGLYEYICEERKPIGYAFNNESWRLIPQVRMFNEDLDKWSIGYSKNELTIAPLNGSYCLFRAMNDITPGNFILQEEYSQYGLDAMRYGYYIGELYMTDFFIGFPASPSDTELDARVLNVWKPVTQKLKDPGIDYAVYKATKDIYYGESFEFRRQDWTIVTQNKKSTDRLYGWVWRKYILGNGGGTPFGADFPIPSLNYNNGYTLRIRFNSLSLYRGDNELNVGEVKYIYSDHSIFDGYNIRGFKAITVGQTGYITGITSNITAEGKGFFIREKFKRSWHFISMNEMDRAENKNFLLYRFLNNGQIILSSLQTKDGNATNSYYKVTITDYINKYYAINFLKSYKASDYVEIDATATLPYIQCMSYGWNTSRALVYNPLNTIVTEGFGYVYEMGSKMEVYCLINNEGEIIYTSYYNNVTGSPSYTTDQFGDGERDRITFLYGHLSKFDTIYSYLLKTLTYTNYEERDIVHGVRWYRFLDDWSGDPSIPGTRLGAEAEIAKQTACLAAAGIAKIDQETVSYGPVHDVYIQGHEAYEELAYVAHYSGNKRPYFCLLPGKQNYYHLPTYGGFNSWITSPPVCGMVSWYSQDHTVCYYLRYLYGYFAKEVYPNSSDKQPLDMGYYELVYLDKVYIDIGYTRTSTIIDSWSLGYGVEVEPNKWATHTDMSTNRIYTTTPSGSGVRVVYYTDDYIYIINCEYGYDPGDSRIVGRSTGLWEIGLKSFTEDGSTSKTHCYFYPIGSFQDQMQALFHLCIIEKIPYYGNQTCTLNYLNKEIKYLCINIAGFNMEEPHPYIIQKKEEYERDKCLLVNISLYNHTSFPTTANSTESLIKNSNDIIIQEVINIEGHYYILNVVLPYFKTMFPNCMNYLRSGLGCYNPAMTGAFFWLTSDNTMYNVDPQYGGPEPGAQGFDGW